MASLKIDCLLHIGASCAPVFMVNEELSICGTCTVYSLRVKRMIYFSLYMLLYETHTDYTNPGLDDSRPSFGHSRFQIISTAITMELMHALNGTWAYDDIWILR